MIPVVVRRVEGVVFVYKPPGWEVDASHPLIGAHSEAAETSRFQDRAVAAVGRRNAARGQGLKRLGAS